MLAASAVRFAPYSHRTIHFTTPGGITAQPRENNTMSSKLLKPATLAGAIVLGGLALSPSAFAVNALAQGYALGATAVAGDAKAEHEGNCGADKAAHEGNCGADHSAAEGKCGEGKCGMNMDTDKDGMVSMAEHRAAADARFNAADANHDGMVDGTEMKAAHEGKCGEGKCGANK
jgi:uncharacterized low-complexity protein